MGEASDGRLYLGVDVGTGSARAGLFDAGGARRGLGVCPFPTWRPREDFVQQSSDAIWDACAQAVRAALAEAGAAPEQVRGLGFDATCSLVALDEQDRPVTVSPDGEPSQNVIVWMDHRAVAQAAAIDRTGHDVLRYVGGVMSPEMEPPKLRWLAEELPDSWARAARLFDLPDFLAYRATGVDVRSLCTTVCKWTYRGDEGRWDESFWRAVGLGALADEGFARIGTDVRPMGERQGGLTAEAADALGLAPRTPVAVSIIDAHAGGLGLLGAAPGPLDDDAFARRLALIGGTSSCHMAVSPTPRFIDGVWGPYFSAMVPGMWLTEGGQSATGALLEHVVRSHARYPELAERAAREGGSVFDVLNARLDALAAREPFAAALTRELHVLPDFHGNRSPRADATARGMISGLKLTDGVDALALLYLATLQAIAHGTRHILAALNDAGYAIDTLVACGGDTKNPRFVQAHADVTGCRVVLPEEPEAVLLGAAMLGATASGDVAALRDAMATMNRPREIVTPAGGEVAAYHARKHEVFLRMYDDQQAYRALIRG